MEQELPFTEVPSGIGIAHYFVEECAGKQQGADGFDLWREGSDYCYVWKMLECDLDYEGSYLLEVRTNIDGEETRDFLFVSTKDGKIDCRWRNQPVKFFCSQNEWNEHLSDGLAWFARLTTCAFADDWQD